MQYFSTYDFAVTFLDNYIFVHRNINILTLSTICKTWYKILADKKFRDRIAIKLYGIRRHSALDKMYLPILSASAKNHKMLMQGYNVFPCINIIFDYGKIAKITSRYRNKVKIRESLLGLYVEPTKDSADILEVRAFECFDDKGKSLQCIHHQVKDHVGKALITYSFIRDDIGQLQPIVIHTEGLEYHLIDGRWYLRERRQPSGEKCIQMDVKIDYRLFYKWFGLSDDKVSYQLDI